MATKKRPATKAAKRSAKADPALEALRKICLALPDAHEVPAWGTFTWRTKKIFAMYAMASDSKHSGGRPGVWLAAAPGNQSLMVKDRPDRFYRPPYVGAGGWVGVWLDRRAAWKEIAALVADSWRLTCPTATRKKLDGK
jgi:predicted DNA-binding protein (MmcQ/YjbR family)